MLVDPNVAIQEMVDEIYQNLCELLPWPHGLALDNPWREVQILTVGSPESVEKDLMAYIEGCRTLSIRNGLRFSANSTIDMGGEVEMPMAGNRCELVGYEGAEHG